MQSVCRCLLGLSFIASAILKFVSVDSFELYIYSWDVMPLWLASWFSRAVLFVEMSLGLSLLVGFYRKIVDGLVCAVLGGFTIFLFGLLIAGVDGNCHCMGESFELSPAQSIAKNLVLFMLLYFSTKSIEPNFLQKPRIKPTLLVLVILASAVFALAKLPYGLGPKKVTVYNDEKLHEWMAAEHLEDDFRSDRSILAFFSTSCRHCKMAMSKLEVCLKKTTKGKSSFSSIPVRWVVWGSEESLDSFMKTNDISEQTHTFLDPKDMMPITEYNIPLILFLEKDSVVSCMSNASFDESVVLEFLNNDLIKR